MSHIALTVRKSYYITVNGIELKAVYVGEGWFHIIGDRYHISETTSIREA